MAGGRKRRGEASVGGGQFEAGALSSGAARLRDEELARGVGPRTKRTKARLAKERAEKDLAALRSRAALTPSQRRATRVPRVAKPLTQRGLTALGLIPSKSRRARAYTEYQLTQLASERRRAQEGLPRISKSERKVRRTAFNAPIAEARAELRASKQRARGSASGRFRAYTSAEQVNKEARDLREQTALLKDQIAKERASLQFANDPAKLQAKLAEIDARATKRAAKAQLAQEQRAARAQRLEAAAQGIRLPRGPRKPRSVEAAQAARLKQLEKLESKLRAKL
jgi:hypothetical protein